jgi:hypothetical protein
MANPTIKSITRKNRGKMFHRQKVRIQKPTAISGLVGSASGWGQVVVADPLISAECGETRRSRPGTSAMALRRSINSPPMATAENAHRIPSLTIPQNAQQAENPRLGDEPVYGDITVPPAPTRERQTTTAARRDDRPAAAAAAAEACIATCACTSSGAAAL